MQKVSVFAGVLCLLGLGCGGVPPLPQTFEVATSASEKFEADKDTGPPSLANSTWTLVRLPDPDNPNESDNTPPGPYGGILSGQALERPPVGDQIFVVEFGEGGRMVNVTGNRFFLPRFYGDQVAITQQWHGTTLPGVSYNSASYGLEVGGRFGIAVIVHVRFGNLFLGRAILYSWGTQAPDRIDGAFGYLLDFTDGIVKGLGTIADQYPIEGLRLVTE
jgi:hypothetical protein